MIFALPIWGWYLLQQQATLYEDVYVNLLKVAPNVSRL
jgi:hypothetical protein